MPIDYGTNNVTSSGNVNVSGIVTATSGVFSNLIFNGTVVSISGHTHTSSNITDFNSSVSGLLPTISNSGDNRVLTSTGSSVGINGESNLTFNGNLLNVIGTGIITSGLGIGTASPTTILHAYNPVSSSSLSEVARFGSSGVYDGNFRIMVGSTSDRGGELRYYEGSTEYSRVNFDVNRIDFMTRGAYPINFLTNNNGNEGHNQRMTITSAGNVGIGTATPSAHLHVIGSGIFASGLNIDNQTASTIASFDSSKNIVSLSTATYPSLTELSYVKGVTSALQTQLNAKQNTLTNPVTGTGAANHIAYWTSSSGIAHDASQLFWDATNNRLGIGTASPSGALNVIGTGLFSTTTGIVPNALLDLYSATSGDMIFNVEGTNGSLFSVIDNLSGSLMSVNNNAGLPVFEVFSDDRVIGGRYNQNDFVISSGGNVGIGTASPTSKLHVIGSGNFSQDVLVNGISVRNKSLCYFTPLDNQPPVSGFATLDTRNSIAVLDFDDTTNESGVFVGILPENASLASGLNIRIHWAATSATSGTCRWGVQFEKMTSDLDVDSFDATVAESGSITNATNGVPTITQISCTGIDSLASGDLFRIVVYRDPADTTNDTMTGDAELIAVEVRSVS